MDNSISYKYEEIINNISSFDKTDTQIILSDANTIESVAELDYLFQLFKNAEISFLIDLNYHIFLCQCCFRSAQALQLLEKSGTFLLLEFRQILKILSKVFSEKSIDIQ